MKKFLTSLLYSCDRDVRIIIIILSVFKDKDIVVIIYPRQHIIDVHVNIMFHDSRVIN